MTNDIIDDDLEQAWDVTNQQVLHRDFYYLILGLGFGLKNNPMFYSRTSDTCCYIL